MNVLKTKRHTFFTDLKELDRVLSLYEEINDPMISEIDWLEGQLVLAEAFTNAVRHAHKNMTSDIPIEVEVTLCSDSIKIKIWDYGAPFDLQSAIEESYQLQDKLAPGKRGLVILDKISDALSYTRDNDERNCLLIIKYYKHSSNI